MFAFDQFRSMQSHSMDLPVLMQKHEEKKRSKYDEKPKHKRTESTLFWIFVEL